MFSPKPPYTVVPKATSLFHFIELPANYFRPHGKPFQKPEWDLNQKQSFLMSLFRQNYIPRLVLREIRLDNKNVEMEILDGRQRIQTLLDFKEDKIQLPCDFANLFPDIILVDPITDYNNYEYMKSRILSHIDIALFFRFNAIIPFDVIKGIGDRNRSEYENTASELYQTLHR